MRGEEGREGEVREGRKGRGEGKRGQRGREGSSLREAQDACVKDKNCRIGTPWMGGGEGRDRANLLYSRIGIYGWCE